jgi:protein-tyrosine phosphatase
MGGYETGSGRRTRGDMLFRGGWFDLANESDVTTFEATGIKHIFDFRSEPERARRPLGEAIRSRANIVELGISPGSMGPYLRSIREQQPEQINCKSAMTRMHYEMLDEGIPRFRTFFRHLRYVEEPFMIMCSTGKDRTGVASALLLAALNVPDDALFDDYLISADAYRGREVTFARNHGLETLGVDLNLVKDVFTVHPEYLRAVWRRIDDLTGSMTNFLNETMSLSDAKLRDLAEKLTC